MNNTFKVENWKVILKNCLLSEVEDKLYEDDDEYDVEIASDSTFADENNEDRMVEREVRCYHIPEVKINVFPSIFCYKNDDDDWESDFSFYAFYDSETNELLYEDSSSVEVGLSNLLHGMEEYKHINMDYIYESMKCDVLEPNS